MSMRIVSRFFVISLVLMFVMPFFCEQLFAQDKPAKEEPKLSVKLNGRVMGDWLWGKADDTMNDFVSGNEWRAAWIEVNGDYGDNIEFKVWYDVASGTAVAKDVWVGLKNLPFGSLRVGHMKEPFGMEQLTSSKNTVFMERSLPDLFVPSRNTGVGIFGNAGEGSFSYGFGVFTDANDQGNATTHDDTYNASGRITTVAWQGGKSEMLHLGAGIHYRAVKDGATLGFSARPESHLAYKLVDTGKFAADSALMYNIEAAIQFGRLSFQGEYIGANVDAPGAGDPSFNGFYAFASFFLTDDVRPYGKATGTFGAVKPKNPWSPDGDGIGAWELAVRYSRLDLEDGAIFGGVLTDVTVGLNWYINNYVRIMGNYIHADRKDLGKADIVQMRYQFTF